MRKTIFLIVFLNIFSASYTQIIRGTILDAETNSPVTYATIYFEGTSIASFADVKGDFKLDIKNIASMPLTISALGYYSVSVNDFSPQKNILVYLTPKVFELQEVSVEEKGNSKIRKRNLTVFRREFLGRTKNAQECEIENEDDIRFITSAKNDTLKAFSINPIIINNKGLGYTITYYLDKFEFIKSEAINQLIGNFLFNDDTTSVLDDQLIELRRNYAYFGSKMHFFRSLWQKNLKSEGFTVKNGEQELTEQELVRDQLSLNPDNAKKYIYYPKTLPANLSILYEPIPTESGMRILANNIYFNKDGYYVGHNIIWDGEMALHGIADLLPYDFRPTYEVKKLYIPKLMVPPLR
jgi:hypothetical protein